MPDITAQFVAFARSHPLVDPGALLLKPKQKERSDVFLMEAYKLMHSISQLQRFVKGVRPRYLHLDKMMERTETKDAALDDPVLLALWLSLASVAVLDDGDRFQLDQQVQVYVQQLNERIRLLQKRIPPENSLMTEHYRAVLWLVERRLVAACGLHRGMQDLRSKQISFQNDIRVAKSTVSPSVPVPSNYQQIFGAEEHSMTEELHFSQEQLQELESENQNLLNELETTLDHVRNATQSIQEISNLQAQLAYQLATQKETVQSLYEEAWQNTETLARANQVLVKTEKIVGEGRWWLFLFFVFAGLILLFLDWYGS